MVYYIIDQHTVLAVNVGFTLDYLCWLHYAEKLSFYQISRTFA